MPSEESMKKARKVLGLHPGREFSPDVYWSRLAGRVATALDERAEECARIAEAHRKAWQEKKNATEDSRERRDYESMSIAAAHVGSSIRSLTKGPNQ